MRRVWRWSARTACDAALDLMRRQASKDFYRATVIWALLTPHMDESSRRPQPDIPTILTRD